MCSVESRRTIVTAREWRLVLALSLVALLITSVPYALGAALATEDHLFGGFVYGVEDGYSYLGKMRQGAEGAWLFRIAYTPEHHPRTLMFLFHLLLGKVAALIPGGADLTTRMVWVYHGARWIFGLILLLTVYRFLAACTDRVAVRRIAWLLVTFGGGMGWLLLALGQHDWLGTMPLDFILPEGFAFLVLYTLPHLALAQTLLLLGVLRLTRAWRTCPKSEVRSPASTSRTTHHVSRITHYVLRITYYVLRTPSLNNALLSGLLWLAMGLIVPFFVGVAWAVMGAAWLVLAIREQRVPWREAMLFGIAALVAVPAVAYSAWIFATQPVYATWATQNRVLSPHPLHYLAAYGAPLALAVVGARHAWRHEKLGWLALVWVGLAPVLAYLPFNLQRRLVAGVQVPLSFLAAVGVSRLRWSGLARRAFVVALLVALSLTNGLLVAGNCLLLPERPAPIYRDAEEVTALDWLGERVDPDGVVLAAYETGNYLPARVNARVFVGHGPESVHADEKRALVGRFFEAATDDAWRRRLLAEYGVDYVWWGPAERALGDFDPAEAAYLRPIYDAEGYAIFEVGP
jgi:hypothetical protein